MLVGKVPFQGAHAIRVVCRTWAAVVCGDVHPSVGCRRESQLLGCKETSELLLGESIAWFWGGHKPPRVSRRDSCRTWGWAAVSLLPPPQLTVLQHSWKTVLCALSRAPVRISPASHPTSSVSGPVTRASCPSHCSGTKASCSSRSPSLIWCLSTTNLHGTSLPTAPGEVCPSCSTMPPM